VTPAGRAIGIALMIGGVGMFGVVAASAAAWFIKADNEQDKQDEPSRLSCRLLAGGLTGR
jgi:ABC-type phosphonate transport system ATPase subunit